MTVADRQHPSVIAKHPHCWLHWVHLCDLPLVTTGKGCGFGFMHGPYCSFAARDGIFCMFSGEVRWQRTPACLPPTLHRGVPTLATHLLRLRRSLTGQASMLSRLLTTPLSAT